MRGYITNRITSYLIGYISEVFVVLFLLLKMYKILKHRFRNKFGEIDIIAVKNSEVFFIEVKSRSKAEDLHTACSAAKINRVRRAASYFLARNSIFQSCNARIQVVFVHGFTIRTVDVGAL